MGPKFDFHTGTGRRSDALAEADARAKENWAEFVREGWLPGGMLRLASEAGWAEGGATRLANEKRLEELWAPGGACRLMVEDCGNQPVS